MNKNGFTFLEMLIVLSIVALLMILTVPLQFNTLNNLKEEQFIEQLKLDVLLVQNQTSHHGVNQMSIRFHDHYYRVLHGRNPTYADRDYPAGWSTIAGQTIRFKETGTFLEPRRIPMYTPTDRIHFVFTLGKGRFYVEREKRILHD